MTLYTNASYANHESDYVQMQPRPYSLTLALATAQRGQPPLRGVVG
jgi:hypothetical protein